MAKRPTKKRKPEPAHHWLTMIALACVILFVLTVMFCNAIGWPTLIPGVLGYAAAVLAIAAAGFAFSLWEHVRLFAKEKRWVQFAGALALFAGALLMDAAGVHSGIDTLSGPWRAELQRHADAEHDRAQRALDQRRAALKSEADAIAATIPAVALVGRPQADEQARLAWTQEHGADAARLQRKRQQLDAIPETAPIKPVAPWLSPAIWAFAIFAEFVVAFGVSVLGIEIAPQFAAGREEEAPPKPAPTPQPENVVPMRQRRSAAARGRQWSGWDD